MSGVVNSIGKVVGTFTGATQQAKAAQQAAGVQAEMASEGIAEQRRQFDALVELMKPYVGAGAGAISQQQALLGLGGVEAQQQAISQIEKSPFFQSMAQQGENAMLQQAAATGGLRGGNMQAALAQFRPGLLNQMVQQQFANLGGLTQVGQASAAGQASQGMQSAGAVGNLLAQMGAAQAGGLMAKGGLQRQVFGDIMQITGATAGAAIAAKKAGMF
jgi:hypothetical protein